MAILNIIINNTTAGRYRLPLVLQGKKVRGEFQFSAQFGKLLRHEVRTV